MQRHFMKPSVKRPCLILKHVLSGSKPQGDRRIHENTQTQSNSASRQDLLRARFQDSLRAQDARSSQAQISCENQAPQVTMDMQNEARVFGDGDVTIVVNMSSASARVYVGTQQVGFLRKLNLSLDSAEPSPQLEFVFPQSHDQTTALRIEEQVRSIKQHLPWAKIIR